MLEPSGLPFSFVLLDSRVSRSRDRLANVCSPEHRDRVVGDIRWILRDCDPTAFAFEKSL